MEAGYQCRWGLRLSCTKHCLNNARRSASNLNSVQISLHHLLHAIMSNTRRRARKQLQSDWILPGNEPPSTTADETRTLTPRSTPDLPPTVPETDAPRDCAEENDNTEKSGDPPSCLVDRNSRARPVRKLRYPKSHSSDWILSSTPSAGSAEQDPRLVKKANRSRSPDIDTDRSVPPSSPHSTVPPAPTYDPDFRPYSYSAYYEAKPSQSALSSGMSPSAGYWI